MRPAELTRRFASRLERVRQGLAAAPSPPGRLHIQALGRVLGVPVALIYRVLDSESPRAEAPLRLCQGSACLQRGAGALRDVLEAAPAAPVFEPVHCLGLCEEGPNFVWGSQVQSDVSPADLRALLRES